MSPTHAPWSRPRRTWGPAGQSRSWVSIHYHKASHPFKQSPLSLLSARLLNNRAVRCSALAIPPEMEGHSLSPNFSSETRQAFSLTHKKPLIPDNSDSRRDRLCRGLQFRCADRLWKRISIWHAKGSFSCLEVGCQRAPGPSWVTMQQKSQLQKASLLENFFDIF